MAAPEQLPADIAIAPGVFSRTYEFPNQTVSVAYHTPSQSVALFEDDSARVWSLLHEDKGSLRRSLAYIKTHGTFNGDPESEARNDLDAFVTELLGLGLISRNAAGAPPAPSSAAIQPGAGDETERQINLLMAEHRVMHSLVLELTYRCNEKCVHCYCPQKHDQAELSSANLVALLDEFETLGGMQLQLTGGELFIRREMRDLLRHLQKRQFVVSLISNLTLLDDELLNLLEPIHPRSVGCSIYSADPTIHDRVTGVPGSHAKSLASIRALRRRRIPVVLKTPLMKHTVSGWQHVEDLARDLGCANQFDLNITARNDGSLSPLDLRVRDKTAISELFTRRRAMLYIHGEPLNSTNGPSEDVLLCGAGATGLAVGPGGSIHPCIGLPLELGLWPTNSLASVWNESHFFTEWAERRLHHIPQCRDCDCASTCFRCPGSWFTETGSVETPNEYTCYLARIASNKCSLQPSC
jgi:radical SAM protein with 4Fe4S-binding SPASM domain